MARYRKLPRSFFTRATLRVARDLLGTFIVRKTPGGRLAGMIVEVEAYLGENDPASHAFRGRTKRNDVMFLRGGHLYVYFTYGMHYCCNVVSGREGAGRAVLIRAIEPVEGIGVMYRNRGRALKTKAARPCAAIDPGLTNGPAKLCRALGITMRENGTDLLADEIFIARRAGDKRDRPQDRTISAGRIGIRYGREKKWRFYFGENPYVSRPG